MAYPTCFPSLIKLWDKGHWESTGTASWVKLNVLSCLLRLDKASCAHGILEHGFFQQTPFYMKHFCT